MPALLVAFALLGCNSTDSRPEGDQLLAKVHNKSLYLSDLEGMIPEGMSGEDSSLIINAFVQNWAKDATLEYVAERNVPKDVDIDKLVKDYKASLIRHNYENLLISNKLDSIVTQVELQEFYQKNRDQYQLESPILRCRFIKAPRNAPNLNKAQTWWNNNQSDDFARLAEWCKQNATVTHLQDSAWFKVEDIAAYMPRNVLSAENVNSRKDFVQKDDQFMYFFKVLEMVSKKEIAPLAYIQGQARKAILHKRKTLLLEETKQKLYDDALKNKNVTIFQ